MVVPREVILVVEMVQLHLMATHKAIKDPVAIEVDPVVAIMRT